MNSKKILVLLGLVIGITLLGALGYMRIEGWGFEDSIYMSVITLTTTGFQEIHRLSAEGRLFTIFLLIIGVGTVAYSATTLMNSIMSIDFTERRRRKMQKKIDNFTGHTIVCGFGRMGQVVCDELKKAGSPFVVVERNEKTIEEIEGRGFVGLEGDASQDLVLVNAGIKRAKTLVCMIDDDADGLYLALAARTLNPEIYVIIRASSSAAGRRMEVAGADKIVLPFIVSGIKVAQNVLNPAVDDFLEINTLNKEASERIQTVDIVVAENSDLVGKALNELKLREDGLMVIGVKKPSRSFDFLPESSYRCQVGDCLLALGTKNSCDQVFKKYDLHT